MAYFLNKDELYHYGILNMKWGVRRFQNPDGTLTAEGKRRYRTDENGNYIKRSRAERKAYDKKVKQLKAAAEARKMKSPRNKDIKQMTDKQLEKYIQRMRLEKDAIDIRNQVNNLDPKPISKGEQFMNLMVEKVVVPAAADAGKKFMNALVDTMIGDNNNNSNNNNNKNKNNNNNNNNGNKGLSDKQRKRATEMKNEGKNYADIAKSMNVSIDAVKNYLG